MSDLWLESLCNGISALQGGPVVHFDAMNDGLLSDGGDVGGTGGDEPEKGPDIHPPQPSEVPAPQAPQPEIAPAQPTPPMDPGIPAPEA